MAVQQMMPHNSFGSSSVPGNNNMDSNIISHLEAWELTKAKIPNSEEKPTYDLVQAKPLNYEQDTLKDMIKQQRKDGAGSVQKDMDNLRSSAQLKRVHELASQKQSMERNASAEWLIVSVKDNRRYRDSWGVQSTSVSTVVILKRQRIRDSRSSSSGSKSKPGDEVKARRPSVAVPGGIIGMSNSQPRHSSAPATMFPGNPNPFQSSNNMNNQGFILPQTGLSQPQFQQGQFQQGQMQQAKMQQPQIHQQPMQFPQQNRPQVLQDPVQARGFPSMGNAQNPQVLNQSQNFGQVPQFPQQGMRSMNIPQPPHINTNQPLRPSLMPMQTMQQPQQQFQQQSYQQQPQQQSYQQPQLQFPTQIPQGQNFRPQQQHSNSHYNSNSAVYSDSDSSSYNDSAHSPRSPRHRRSSHGRDDDYTPPSTPGSSQYFRSGGRPRSGSWGSNGGGAVSPKYAHVREHQKPSAYPADRGAAGYPGERGVSQPFRSVGGGGRRDSGLRVGSLEEGMRGMGLGGAGAGRRRTGGGYEV